MIEFELALAFVIFPSAEVESASAAVAAESGVRRRYSDEQRLRTLELVDACNSSRG